MSQNTINIDQIFTQAYDFIGTIGETIYESPAFLAAQPAIGVLGATLGGISGYELGRTTVLKARGLWHPKMMRPIVVLAATVALAALSVPYVALSITIATVAAAVFGAIKGIFEKEVKGLLNFKDYQKNYGVKPLHINSTSPQDFLKIASPTLDDACGLLWGLTKEACKRGESFTEGTFVLEGDQAKEIYEKLRSIDGSYRRHSSHFTGRGTKNPQMGLDFSKESKLPADKRTILFGIAKTDDDHEILFIKPENWGADNRIFKSLQKANHFFNHTLQFFHAQYVKIMRPGYDDRPGTAKERIPHEWSVPSKFGWASLTDDQKQNLIDRHLAKEEWLNDRYRTGREVYIVL